MSFDAYSIKYRVAMEQIICTLPDFQENPTPLHWKDL